MGCEGRRNKRENNIKGQGEGVIKAERQRKEETRERGD
jgi:hypothetical protein